MKIKNNYIKIMCLLLTSQFSYAAISPQIEKLPQRNIMQIKDDIIVAIIDTGADLQHPLYQENLWQNNGEMGPDKNGHDKSNNGIDDDHNGYIDDINGWNFVNNNKNLHDNHGHGTHIAGIVKAQNIENKRIKLMILKYFDPAYPRADTLEGTIKAIEYAVKMNAKIINFSGGGTDASFLEKKAIEYAKDKGVLVVAAAGNESRNSDISGFYPADYDIENIISVTATDKDFKILPTSNYGKNTVHFAALGKNILSSLPNNKYGKMTGTSQATAIVSGIIANLFSENRNIKDYKQIVDQLKNMSLFPATLSGKTKYNAYLNGQELITTF